MRMNERFSMLLSVLCFSLTGCAADVASSTPDDELEGQGQAMINEGRHNSCSASQLSGGYEDVDGDCLLTCWNCPGWVGGGSGGAGGCTTSVCDGSGGGSGGSGGGSGGGGGGRGEACVRRHDSCFDNCPATPVLPEDATPAQLRALQRAERCYDRCDDSFDLCISG
jgi:hypothetical protein